MLYHVILSHSLKNTTYKEKTKRSKWEKVETGHGTFRLGRSVTVTRRRERPKDNQTGTRRCRFLLSHSPRTSESWVRGTERKTYRDLRSQRKEVISDVKDKLRRKKEVQGLKQEWERRFLYFFKWPRIGWSILPDP